MRIIAIDYGRKRIGLAVSDETATIASGIGVIDRNRENEPLKVIAEHIGSYGVEKVIIGYPLRQNGERGELADEVDRFAAELELLGKISVQKVDEAFTSEMAAETLSRQGMRKKKHRRHIDRVAACHILQSYLDGKST